MAKISVPTQRNIRKYVSIRDPTVSFHPYSVISTITHVNWYDSFQCATWLFSTFYWRSTIPHQTASLLRHNRVTSTSQLRHVTIASLSRHNRVTSTSQSRLFHVTIVSLPRHNQRRFFVTTVCRLLPPTPTITSTNTRQHLSTTGFTLTVLNFLRQFNSPLRTFLALSNNWLLFPTAPF